MKTGVGPHQLLEVARECGETQVPIAARLLEIDTADQMNLMLAAAEFLQQGQVGLKVTPGADADQMNGGHGGREQAPECHEFS